MSYLTPRKRARALGAAHEGVGHHWRMIVTSVMLVGLVPLFVFTLGPVIGRPYPEVAQLLAHPLRALVIGGTLLVGLIHFRLGVQVVLEDYAHGTPRKIMVIAMILLTYSILAIGLLAVARLAL